MNRLGFFHTTEFYSWDLMHDQLRGVADSVVKLVLKKFTKLYPNEPDLQPIIRVEELNNRINSFVYGYVDRRDKPSANFTYDKIQDRSHDLPQKAVQMWCLARALPFLLHDLVPNGDPHMEFLILYLKIITIVFSPRLTHAHLAYLNDLLHQHQRLRIELFPELPPINKDHYMRHYVEAIIAAGVLSNYDCLSFERYHAQIHRRAHVCCNFQDICVTTARTCQMYQCSVWSAEDPREDPPILRKVDNIKKKIQVLAQSLDAYPFLADNGVREHDLITIMKSVTLFGTEYRPKMFLIVDTANENDDDLPVFAIIEQLLLLRDVPHAVVSTWQTVGHDPSLNAYRIDDVGNRNDRMVQLDALVYYQPLSIWRAFGSNAPFLCPRHIIF